MGLNTNYYDGQTPLDDDEKEGLRIPTIQTRGDLDEFEQLNIEEAILWTLSRSFKPEYILTENFVRNLHKKMFANVWNWAGEFRKTNKNLGIDKWHIPTELKYLLDNAKYWIEEDTYSPDEMVIRFKHRLVSIHCFPNGNGRHSRLMADIMIHHMYKLPVFTWGAMNVSDQNKVRILYIKALKAADQSDFNPLIQFSRS
jgi:Fic-DOC domain mobile mystery protein B